MKCTKQKAPNKEKPFDIKRYNSISIISGRFVCLAFTFSVSVIFKGICLRQAYIPSLDSHCLSLTTTVSFRPLATTFAGRALNTPWSLAMRSCTGFRVSRHFWRYTSLSFLFRSSPPSCPVPPPFFISYLRTMLVSISIHCARHAERKTSLLKSCAATTQVI